MQTALIADFANGLHRMLTIAAVVAACSACAVSDNGGLRTQFLNSNPNFSQLVTVDQGGVRTIYVSGQVGIRDGQVPATFLEQVDATFENMARQLDAAGASMADVVKITGFIVDINAEKVAQYSQGRSRHFGAQAQPPASTLLGISGLVREELLVEVEAVAVIPAD